MHLDNNVLDMRSIHPDINPNMPKQRKWLIMKTRTKFVTGGAVILAVIFALSLQELQKMTVFLSLYPIRTLVTGFSFLNFWDIDF